MEQSGGWEDRYAQTGFFNISSMAQQRIADKRKRKGLGPLKPREKNVFGQIITFGTSLAAVKSVGAPLDRLRIMMQTMHMQNVKAAEKPSGSTQSFITSKYPYISHKSLSL